MKNRNLFKEFGTRSHVIADLETLSTDDNAVIMEHQFHNIQHQLIFELNINASKKLLTYDYMGALQLLESIQTSDLQVIKTRCNKLLKTRYSSRLSDEQRNVLKTKITIIEHIIDIRNAILTTS